jgi:signal transduction histidine kinase
MAPRWASEFLRQSLGHHLTRSALSYVARGHRNPRIASPGLFPHNAKRGLVAGNPARQTAREGTLPEKEKKELNLRASEPPTSNADPTADVDPLQIQRALPELALLLDEGGRIVHSSSRHAGENLSKLRIRKGCTPHEILHPDCDEARCMLDANWQRAWKEIRSGQAVEWFSVLRSASIALRLRLQPVSYACSVLFGRTLDDYKHFAVLFVRDLTEPVGTESSSHAHTERNIRSASVYRLRRADDPNPSLVASLDSRLRTLTGRLLLSRESERRRIASELHDGLGQSLSLLKLEIEGCLERARHSEEVGFSIDDLERAHDHARLALTDLRAITSALRPTAIDDMGLIGAIKQMCSDFQGVMRDVVFDLDFDETGHGVPDELAVTIYRITQEALHNVARHAEATAVQLRLRSDETGVALQVSDNGVGLPEDASMGRGVGLITMRERAETLGGICSVESKVGGGCQVEVSWPIEAIDLLR